MPHPLPAMDRVDSSVIDYHLYRNRWETYCGKAVNRELGIPVGSAGFHATDGVQTLVNIPWGPLVGCAECTRDHRAKHTEPWQRLL